MKEYKVYICEKCGQEFPDDYIGCKDHEEGHIRTKAYDLWNNGSYQSGDKYPSLIKIPMADGAEVLYKFDGIEKEPEQKESPRGNEDDLYEKPVF